MILRVEIVLRLDEGYLVLLVFRVVGAVPVLAERGLAAAGVAAAARGFAAAAQARGAGAAARAVRRAVAGALHGAGGWACAVPVTAVGRHEVHRKARPQRLKRQS